MLTENKFSKYLLYAFGEIVLVMLGILLALQVNNWNEAKKKEHLKNEYKAALKNDYIKDTTQLNDRFIYNEKIIDSISEMKEELETTPFSNSEEVLSIMKKLYRINMRTVNTYNNNSFNLLISSGNIDLLDKEIREAIMELNRLQLYEQEVSLINRERMVIIYSNFNLKYPPLDFPNKSVEQLFWKGTNTDELPKDLFHLINVRADAIFRYLQLSKEVLQQTNVVLKLMEDPKK